MENAPATFDRRSEGCSDVCDDPAPRRDSRSTTGNDRPAAKHSASLPAWL